MTWQKIPQHRCVSGFFLGWFCIPHGLQVNSDKHDRYDWIFLVIPLSFLSKSLKMAICRLALLVELPIFIHTHTRNKKYKIFTFEPNRAKNKSQRLIAILKGGNFVLMLCAFLFNVRMNHYPFLMVEFFELSMAWKRIDFSCCQIGWSENICRLQSCSTGG